MFGLWFIEELGHHGYKLSPGTLYPVLHGLERKGYLRSEIETLGKRSRRMYRATPLGRKVLAIAKEKVTELFGELLEDDELSMPERRAHRSKKSRMGLTVK